MGDVCEALLLQWLDALVSVYIVFGQGQSGRQVQNWVMRILLDSLKEDTGLCWKFFRPGNIFS